MASKKPLTLSLHGETVARNAEGDIEIRVRRPDVPRYTGAVVITMTVDPSDGISTDEARLTLHEADVASFVATLTAAVRQAYRERLLWGVRRA